MKMNQNELAALVGAKSKAVVSNWERGANLPTIDVVLKIARHSKVNLDWLIEGIGKPIGENVAADIDSLLERLTIGEKNLIRDAFTSENSTAIKLALNLIFEKQKYYQIINDISIQSIKKDDHER